MDCTLTLYKDLYGTQKQFARALQFIHILFLTFPINRAQSDKVDKIISI